MGFTYNIILCRLTSIITLLFWVIVSTFRHFSIEFVRTTTLLKPPQFVCEHIKNNNTGTCFKMGAYISVFFLTTLVWKYSLRAYTKVDNFIYREYCGPFFELSSRDNVCETGHKTPTRHGAWHEAMGSGHSECRLGAF